MSLINHVFTSSQDVVNIIPEWRGSESLLAQPEFTRLSFHLLISEGVNNTIPQLSFPHP